MATQLQEIAKTSDFMDFVEGEIHKVYNKKLYQEHRLNVFLRQSVLDEIEVENIRIKIESYDIQIIDLQIELNILKNKLNNLIQNN